MKFLKFLPIFCLMFLACSEDSREEEGEQTDSFDRGAMLENWADHIIIPSFQAFNEKTENMVTIAEAFEADPSEENFEFLRASFRQNYQEFQTVSLFEIGPAEERNYRLFLNTYPANTLNIDAKATSGEYNLDLPSSYAEQGFPALDYLLYGVADSEAEILSFYQDGENSENHRAYLKAVVTKINDLTSEVTAAWEGDYRNSFVNNTSSSSTGSVDRFTNDFVMYFEKYLRTGKIGYPAGAFTGTPLPGNVEGLYAEDLSKDLYLEALQTVQDFFYGVQIGTDDNGPSYWQYLDYLDEMKDGQKLSAVIGNAFSDIRNASSELDASFKNQVETDNTKMLQSFDELQKLVILFKLDMMQALSVSVDYVDSDGD